MIDTSTWVQQLLEGSLDSTVLPLLERALCNDTLRGLILNKLEKYIFSSSETFLDPRRPARVQQDKADMTHALLRSFARALERRQVSRTVLHRMLKTFLASNVVGLEDDALKRAVERFARAHEGQKPPWTMVVSPTKVCNLRCTGCYASAGPGGERLAWDILDRILTEAKTLWGIRFFTISGGEPFAYRSHGKGLLDAVARHDDCFFMVYTNGTLLDRRAAERMAELGNVTPAISVEGFEARTDERRGPGVFPLILTAMANLRQAGVPYGISLTATRENAEEILSEEFIDFFFEEQQAVYGWLFQYMPIGRGYTFELLPTPEQRLWMWRRIWQIIREREILLADFWNCGTVSEGCIAAGVDGGYLYIDWNGKVMPCVFVPYSPANIHEIYGRGGTLNDIYDLPYFRAIRRWQWEYGLGKQCPEEHGNWLLPCSIRDHYGTGRELIIKYRPEPEDEAAADALRDPAYREGLVAYDQALHEVFDPIWEAEYLKNDVRSVSRCPGRERARSAKPND